MSVDEETPQSMLPAELGLDSVPHPVHGAVAAILDGEAVVLEPDGAAHVLNSSASLVWEALDGERSVRQICRTLAPAGVSPAGIEEDVLSFVRLLGAQGLLEGVERALSLPPARPGGLDIGTPLPLYDRLGTTRTTLLVSWSPWCGYCRQLAPLLRDHVAGLARNRIDVVVVEATDNEETPALLASAGLDVTLRVDAELARAGQRLGERVLVVDVRRAQRRERSRVLARPRRRVGVDELVVGHPNCGSPSGVVDASA